MSSFRGVRLLLVLLVVVSGAAPASAISEVQRQSNETVEPTLAVTVHVSPDPENGQYVRVRVTAKVPQRVTSFSYHVRQKGSSVLERNGFRGSADNLRWDGSTRTPNVTFVTSPVSFDREMGGYDAYSTKNWTFAPRRAFGTIDYEATGDVNVQFEQVFERDAYAGGWFVYAGNHTVAERQTPRERFTVIAPAGANIDLDDDVLDRLENASAFLDIGKRYDHVEVFLPPGPIRGGGRAMFNNTWVQLGSAKNRHATIHEYVHTRRRFAAESEMVWFTEASAEYFSALYKLHAGEHTYPQFYADANTKRYGKQVLSEPDSWVKFRVPYEKGHRVLAALDVRIRRATDGERTLMDVHRRVNEHDGWVSYGDFRRIVNDVAGTSQDGWLDRYVRSSDTPTVPCDPALFGSDAEGVCQPDGSGLSEEGKQAKLNADVDDDGLTNQAERAVNTDPFVPDTDGDGLLDGEEERHDADPTKVDTDDDGLLDSEEVALGTRLRAADTDEDGVPDAREREDGTDPVEADSDGDWLDDGKEGTLGTDPRAADTDGDTLIDGVEIRRSRSDPLAEDTDGDGYGDGEESQLPRLDPRARSTETDYRIATVLKSVIEGLNGLKEIVEPIVDPVI